ncbi:lytic murein transglycosylase [Exilibacterium tricleocarpae]|uniref:Lytic murein transglycosylase n=1 Tax=Exilibacterium tricleocarpae TaxID=2591008 RepID=A0A545U9C1_9GAMM|nr:lytic murein transglycosylase [Exilibacterium tricleocarpae]TQV86072.1 lytic murein transglycosylase [Exilibacterium tricleocarpae]
MRIRCGKYFGVLFCALFPVSLFAASTPFEVCISSLQQQARAQGLSVRTVELLAQVSPVERVIELDRRQPEFNQSFADYLTRRVTADRVQRGRAQLRRHRSLLNRIAVDTGVPAHYLVAFWGLETNFGSFLGSMPVLDSLATLACDLRRSSYFTGELLAALEIVDRDEVTPQQMRGSWAGAFGHVQFMPSVFLRYAIDGDNDGRRDLWGSIPDAMASAGNYLANLGWQREERWGREVRLPEDFPYHMSGIDKPQPLANWRRLGVRTALNKPLATVDMQAALLLPAGSRGPAFLVYDNFHTIMGWNRSEFYALAVGRLADRIAGAGGLWRAPPADVPQLPRQAVQSLQTELVQRGLEPGKADGILGPATRAAIRAFQHDRGMLADGYPHPEVLRALGLENKDIENKGLENKGLEDAGAEDMDVEAADGEAANRKAVD